MATEEEEWLPEEEVFPEKPVPPLPSPVKSELEKARDEIIDVLNGLAPMIGDVPARVDAVQKYDKLIRDAIKRGDWEKVKTSYAKLVSLVNSWIAEVKWKWSKDAPIYASQMCSAWDKYKSAVYDLVRKTAPEPDTVITWLEKFRVKEVTVPI
jgi:hypothetical protein